MSIDQDKLSFDGPPKFRLANATVYRSPAGFTFSKFLDSGDTPAPVLSDDERAELHAYLEKQLQANKQRPAHLLALLRAQVEPGREILDVGCGGGSFLIAAREAGYVTTGVEMEPNRAHYCRSAHGLNVLEDDICSEAFRQTCRGKFAAVSLWDVIEHVNFPQKVLQAACEVLADGGALLIDTPAKDSFYHRAGAATYAATFGRFPTFLNIMYSERPFGHKQIFSTAEMRALLEAAGFETIVCRKIHELNFPYSFYLGRLVGSAALGERLAPAADLFFRLFKIRNKMIVVARKRPAAQGSPDH